MIAEHMGLADDMLPALQHVLAAAPPQRPAAPDMLASENLRTISDVDFDQAYAEQQVGDHLAPPIEAHLQLAVALTQHIAGDSPLKLH
jgi:hypothetical protein